ncbi:MAG: hypothetical protein ABEJ27_01805 [Halodesulfurarchaeum sp.]
MNERMLTGGLLAGCGTIAAVINAWAGHLFFALFHIARERASRVREASIQAPTA